MSSDYRDPNTWRLQTAGGIPFRVVKQGGSFNKEEASASVEYLVESNKLLAFALEMLPEPAVIGDRIVYLGGSSLPGVGVDGMRADSVKWAAHIDGKPVDPFSADTTAASGTYGEVCTVVVEYKTSKEDDENDDQNPETFLEISGSATGDYLNTTAAGGVKWEVNQAALAQVGYSDEFGNPLTQAQREAMAGVNKNPDIPITIMVPQTEWTIRWPRIPWNRFRGLYVGRLRQALGRVNSTTFGLLFNAPAETILFTGYDYSEQYTWRQPQQGRAGGPGKPTVTLTLKLLEKNITDGNNVYGHNHFWKPGLGWTRIKLDLAGTIPPYKQFNMNQIFLTGVQPGEVNVFI